MASAQSDIGKVRTVNEDAVLVCRPDGREYESHGVLALLADGMGGANGGGIASQIAIRAIPRRYLESRSNPSKALRAALEAAGKEIYRQARRGKGLQGMGATCVALALNPPSAWAAWVGDSRLYLLRSGQIYQMTEDHSVVGELRRQGSLTAEEALRHEDRNVVTRALGSRPDVEIAFWREPFPTRPGDRFLLCSDGLRDLLSNIDILNIAGDGAVDHAADRGGELARRPRQYLRDPARDRAGRKRSEAAGRDPHLRQTGRYIKTRRKLDFETCGAGWHQSPQRAKLPPQRWVDVYYVSMGPRLYFLFCLSFSLAAQTATVTVSSADIKIDPLGADSYTIQGSFAGIAVDGAQSILFGIGPFAAAIPLSAFVQQDGTNVYQYNDATGLIPYWLSSLTIDLDANVFNATASGIVLAGLTNPFAVRLGTDVSSACGIARVESVATGEYQMTPADPPTQACAIAAAPVAEPPVVPIGATSKITVRMAAGGLDAKSAMVFRADDNAQPSGPALCTMTDNGGGVYSCTATFNETSTGPIRLVAQATVGGQPVLGPGFAIQAVAPISDADMQQLADIQDLMLDTGEQAYNQYGDSVYARVQVLEALRQYMQAPVGLTGQPVALSADASELSVQCDSGLPVIYQLGDPVDPDSSSQTTPARVGQGARSASRPADAMALPRIGHPDAQTVQQCGDFDRDIVANTQVLLWDPGALFFRGNDAGPFIEQEFKNSKCPAFKTKELFGVDADLTSIAQFGKYGTILMNTHGFVDGNGRFFIVTGQRSQRDKDFWGSLAQNTQAGTWCGTYQLPLPPPANRAQGCFVTLYSNWVGWKTIAPNSIVYGGFCNGFMGNSVTPPPQVLLSLFPTVLAPTSTNAFFGFNFPVFTNVNANTGAAIFFSMLKTYSSASGARDDAVAKSPQLNLYPFGSNLAYVGNPHLFLTNAIKPITAGGQTMAANLDGTLSCGTDGPSYANVMWMNPAKAGHLLSRTTLESGMQDTFTNQATQQAAPVVLGNAPVGGNWAMAEYTPATNLPQASDNIMADFYPDLANPTAAARGCLKVTGAGLFLNQQLAAEYNAGNPEAIPPLANVSPAMKMIADYNVPVTNVGGAGANGASASAEIKADANGNTWTVTLKAGGTAPGPGQGPYQGKTQVGLFAINPGAAGQAHIRIDGQINDAPVCTGTVCSFPDGVIMLTDSAGKTTNFSLSPLDKQLPSFPVLLDSSNSGNSPVFIFAGMNVNAEVKTAASFSMTLTITFLNQ